MADSDGHSSTTQDTTGPERPAITLPARATGPIAAQPPGGPRTVLAKTIARRPRMSWWLGMVIALGFALLVTPTITAERWLTSFGVGEITQGQPAGITIRVAPFAGQTTYDAHIGGGGIVIARGEIATRDQAADARAVRAATPRGGLPFAAFFVLAFVFAALFTHHMRRSTKGRLLRVQLVSLATVVALAIVVKLVMLTTALSMLVVPLALLAMIPTMVLDRIVGLATGVLAALVTSLLIPFDVTVAIILLVQTAAAGLVVAEHPKERWRAVLTAGAITTLFTAATYVLLMYLTTGMMPSLTAAYQSPLLAAAIGPALATLIAVPLLPIYQLLVGEITAGKLVSLEDLSNPLLKQIAERAPGTWQHSLMMANMAEIAANAIGASGRLVRVGAYYHDLGKSLQPKYFIENLEAGETSPHDQLPPEVSCDAIFEHVTEGIVTARRAGLHERIVDFMHMHHGNGVLEYFWARCREQGNPHGFTVENFRYPGHPPQSRETAILAICDAVEAAARTLKKPDPASIDSLVQRIVYGKLHLGQLDESGLSMSDLRQISDSLRETIRHANHSRIEYPWQKAQQDASASQHAAFTQTSPRLDSLDRKPRLDSGVRPAVVDDARSGGTAPRTKAASNRMYISVTGEPPDALAETADLGRPGDEPDDDRALVETAPAMSREAPAAAPAVAPPTAPARPSDSEVTRKRPRTESQEIELRLVDRRRGGSGRLAVPLPDAAAPAEALPDQLPDHLPDLPSGGTRVPRPRTDSDLRSGATRVPRPRTESERALPGPAPDLISPATFGDPPPAARKRAATLPPTPRSRAPSVPAPSMMPVSGAPSGQVVIRHAGPPSVIDFESATTHPPPIRRSNTEIPPLQPTHLPAVPEEDLRVTTPRATVVEVSEAPFDDDASTTAERLPRQARTSAEHAAVDPAATLSGDPLQRAVDIAARIDASIDRDEWSMETPVIAPSRAELRALLGMPDPTRKQSLEELERLHRASHEEVPEPEILTRRPHSATTEVDPDDIESAIEIAPPARRHHSVAVAKPKKPAP